MRDQRKRSQVGSDDTKERFAGTAKDGKREGGGRMGKVVLSNNQKKNRNTTSPIGHGEKGEKGGRYIERSRGGVGI